MYHEFALVVFRVGSYTHALWALSYDVLTCAQGLELGGVTVLRVMVPADRSGDACTWEA